MRYMKAEIILPKEILELVQEYADGQFLYIPKKTGNRRSWGEGTSTRLLNRQRDYEIFHKYRNGVSTKELASEYYLSVKSIQRIILNGKKSLIK